MSMRRDDQFEVLAQWFQGRLVFKARRLFCFNHEPASELKKAQACGGRTTLGVTWVNQKSTQW
jgi:hypothetical protein